MADEQRRIFSVVGTLPEPGGDAVAKFSRSARPYQEWIQELTQEGAARFYEQFYFSYGHGSIADLAHLTMVAENISIIAAIEILDEQLVDAQESSTRYQDFTRRRFYTPPEIATSPLSDRYAAACDRAFTAYHSLHRSLVPHFERAYESARPADLPEDEYRRILRARAFDVARYLLPSSTYTGLGYLCSARTLERQISRMASHPLDEIREIAAELKRSATEPAYNPLSAQVQPAIDALAGSGLANSEEVLAQLRRATLADAAAAPTLVRYTAPRPYLAATLASAREAASRMFGDLAADGQRGVTLAAAVDPVTEVAATLLYRGSTCSYTQVLDALQALAEPEVEAIADLAYAGRGPHDELVREARAGFQLTFDLCLDNGAFRDLHRHRNCVQIIKDFTGDYGYDTPGEILAIGAEGDYARVMDEAARLAQDLERMKPGLGQYALPLAYRRRALFKMDSAQLTYMVEQRTAPAGHFSYRDIAFRMYEAFAARFPSLARQVRVTDPSVESLFDR